MELSAGNHNLVSCLSLIQQEGSKNFSKKQNYDDTQNKTAKQVTSQSELWSSSSPLTGLRVGGALEQSQIPGDILACLLLSPQLQQCGGGGGSIFSCVCFLCVPFSLREKRQVEEFFAFSLSWRFLFVCLFVRLSVCLFACWLTRGSH